MHQMSFLTCFQYTELGERNIKIIQMRSTSTSTSTSSTACAGHSSLSSLCGIYVCIIVLETRSQVTQASLELSIGLRMTIHFCSYVSTSWVLRLPVWEERESCSQVNKQGTWKTGEDYMDSWVRRVTPSFMSPLPYHWTPGELLCHSTNCWAFWVLETAVEHRWACSAFLECACYYGEQNSTCIRKTNTVLVVRAPRWNFEKSIEALAVSCAQWNGVIR